MEDEIRKPDKPIRERLIPLNPYHNNLLYYNSEEEQLRKVLEESESDFEFQHAIILSRREQEERETRAKHVSPVKSKFKQFMRIDKPNKDFYEDIIRYMEKYETNGLNKVSVGEEYHLRFRRTLDNMRLSPEEKSKLLEIIIQ